MIQLNKAFPDWLENYKLNEFDCSEMSAFVYEYLDCCGLEPELKTGYNFREGWAHAWVFCQGKIIERTTLSIPHGRDLQWYNNITPCTIVGDTTQDYDWWNSEYMKEKLEWFN